MSELRGLSCVVSGSLGCRVEAFASKDEEAARSRQNCHIARIQPCKRVAWGLSQVIDSLVDLLFGGPWKGTDV